MFLRFPVKRLSTPKQEPQETDDSKPVKKTIPSKRARGRQRMKQQKQHDEDEDENEEEEEVDNDKEEVLSQSLRKRDKNIKENKAMVMNSESFLCFPHILTVWVIIPVLVRCPLTLTISVVFQLAKLFADLSTMADLTLPIASEVS